ncbi:MAG: ABC transporter permease [Bacteriovoracaceae bacterium]|nr:ABC transporter permease [Bacteriovoracaceae bacterium]
MGSTWSIFKIISEGKAASRFLVAALLSFSFSIAVILSTIGLMDGFELTLRNSLKGSSGDFQITSTKGFFLKEKLSPVLEDYSWTSIMQLEAFAVANGTNKGVLVKGIEAETFQKITNLAVNVEGGVAIGSELASTLKVQVGDEILLTFASDQMRDQAGAILKKYPVTSIVKHGIYEKDLRFVYIDRGELVQTFNYKKGAVNKSLVLNKEGDDFEVSRETLEAVLADSFKVEPYWAEYKTLLRAVEVEKASIGLILQIIVVVAIFNVVAFIIFIMEKKSQEFFLLRAFGASVKTITRFWKALLFFVWLISSVLAVGMTWIFDWLIGRLPVFELPGDIYVLSKLKLELGLEDYALVFSLALGWILLIGTVTMWRMKKRTVLSGLRQEFK